MRDEMDDQSGKRKRDEPSERKNGKERKVKARQEEMEDEFRATYLQLTSFYKYLEVVHLKSPLLLPRTLKYRIDAKKKAPALQGAASTKASRAKAAAKKDDVAPTAAAFREFKFGITAETLDVFKRENHRIGLLLSVFTAKGIKFAENEFELVATSLIPGANAA